ncbi:undecaprenyl/decaprenyl-phosphate alpha-N-acetylglucosaminyl 1-phosphate transferase [Streptomyces sp. NBC_01221]|uniref:MraY family glycosyltransferase n=2 Tax=unclassified Streptomyces TaxID=2593676 RepID=UPI00225682ED|nr:MULTISPECIES: MraY family glycosyltransferase [unclassified Streptomyces]WSP56801.1 undecaprenyl/decaprenyl-phosphate alpha-N-acetylglucosaminyl 1-phosphate transferase [Streptomyces sp. NBC_01241]WSU22481.1 undecaprenyl/decaprenyl-phosphate alpha-N-acetylglucosaminyl 1-phosphate transferase [Streptomyces sp. NBC_01108]MCX4788576.1 undecaprenyl/decaprenyl-phosphate alpha-N-acetylglucosaminyl 1-phosphate transferase [Streptomyces sp. NBC_01221]MCX4795677.1 undecaprenyl/decaprenyl-phosphate al
MRDYLLMLFITAAVTHLLTAPVRKFAISIGAMPEIRARDVHREPTPRLGGIAMFGGLLAGYVVASHMPHLKEIFTQSSTPGALLSGASLIWLLGVLDDKWELDSLVKLGGQVLAAGVMAFQGLTILWLPVPGTDGIYLADWQGTLLTVGLIVFTINAVNFVDGLDGLAAGTVGIAATAFFLYAYRLWYGYGIESAAATTLISAILVGMCLGFLVHNTHPARIFMGDSGSMLLGLLIAGCAISVTGEVDPSLLKQTVDGTSGSAAMVPVYIPLLLPLSVIALPVADLVLAVVRRTWNGRSPFSADKGHLHHRLLQLGHSQRRAVLLMYFWSALFSFGIVAYSARGAKSWMLFAVAFVSGLGLLLLLQPRYDFAITDLLARMRLMQPRNGGRVVAAGGRRAEEHADDRRPRADAGQRA